VATSGVSASGTSTRSGTMTGRAPSRVSAATAVRRACGGSATWSTPATARSSVATAARALAASAPARGTITAPSAPSRARS
jgi:hypothetical protein